MDTYHVIGLMSGTSLDGLDIAYCRLQHENGRWNTKIIEAETIEYTTDWLGALKTAQNLTGEQLMQLHAAYGKYLGEQVKNFITEFDIDEIDLVASHGHTIFHQPNKGFTFQLGDGATLASACGITAISDFRSTDVALGGQGAPLVPIGDELLFSEYELCLNLGGFANISYSETGRRLAFDICPVNIVLNALAQQKELEYDKNGSLARSGQLNKALLDNLDSIPFFSQSSPKSLGREWLDEVYMPILNKNELAVEDKLRTVCENIANQIARAIKEKNGKILITGGGAFNQYLVELIQKKTRVECVIPDAKLVNYKEALVFALLGVLRLRGAVNCLASVTGASRDSVGGSIYSV